MSLRVDRQLTFFGACLAPKSALQPQHNTHAWLQSSFKMANHAKNLPSSNQVVDECALNQCLRELPYSFPQGLNVMSVHREKAVSSLCSEGGRGEVHVVPPVLPPGNSWLGEVTDTHAPT